MRKYTAGPRRNTNGVLSLKVCGNNKIVLELYNHPYSNSTERININNGGMVAPGFLYLSVDNPFIKKTTEKLKPTRINSDISCIRSSFYSISEHIKGKIQNFDKIQWIWDNFL